MPTELWARFEQDVQRLLGLDATPASGAGFRAPGDAVDTRHPRDEDYRMMADCKHTEHGSFSLNLKFLRQWVERAEGFGRRFVLPVRFHVKVANQNYDFVVLPLDDFAELCDRAGVRH
jgi:hypothetical protein